MSGMFGKDRTINISQNKIGALRVQNSSQGLPVPIVIGTTRITSNLLWYDDFKPTAHTESTQQGGKGGGSTTTENTTYTYTVGCIFGLHEGPAALPNFIKDVWANKDLTNATTLGLSEFDGGYTQTPWSYLTTNHANQALAYRGNAYAANGAYDLGASDGLPNLSFEVVGFLGDGDQNIADCMELLLTADKFGAGWPVAQLGNLSNLGAYCAAAGLLISPGYVAQQPMAEILKRLLVIANSAPLWSEGQLKVKPYADTTVGSYVPDLTIQYYLGYDDFLAEKGVDPVRFDRKRQADAYNSVKVECLDREKDYNTYVAEAKDQWAIDTYGLRPMEQISAHEICDPAVGRRVAQQVLQRELYVRNVYTFTLGWKYGRLEPMDIVAITDPKLHLVQQPVRLTSVEEDDDGNLTIEAEELNIGVSTPGSYTPQSGGGTQPNNAIPPGNAVAPVIMQPPLALTGGRTQLWLGSAGGANWGGAEVWASQDNATFQRMGVIQGPARFGALTANFALGADPDTVNTLSVDLSTSNGVLTSAANEVADAGGTVSYVSGANGGELVAYSEANLTGPNAYTMGGYIRRGQYGSNISAHLAGAEFMRLDQAVAAFPISPALFGTTIFVKLLSYNNTGGALQALDDVPTYTFNIVAQVITNGSGYPYLADKSSTANTPAAGRLRWNNASQANTTALYFNDLAADGANMAAFLTNVGSIGFVDLRDPLDTGKWATYRISAQSAANGVHSFTVAFQAGGVPFPDGAPITATFTPTVPNGVQSVGLTMPSIFSVANSPLTANGTLAVTLGTQNAATVFAGPATGNAAAPAFRALALTDIPAGANGQVLTTSNGAAAWANSVAGTGALTINPQTANYILAAGDFNVSTMVQMNSSSNLVLTVPSNANASLANGSSVAFTRQGNGTLTVAAQANVTVHNTSSNTLRVQFSPAALVKVGTDEWNLFGDLS